MIYELKKGGLTAKVDSLGAQLISLQAENGFEHIWAISRSTYAASMFSSACTCFAGRQNEDWRRVV